MLIEVQHPVDDLAVWVLRAPPRTGSGLCGEDADLRIPLSEVLRKPPQRPTGSCHQNEGIDPSVRIPPDLRPRGSHMGERVVRVGGLVEKVKAWTHRPAVRPNLFKSCLLKRVCLDLFLGYPGNITSGEEMAPQCQEDLLSLPCHAGFQEDIAVVSLRDGHRGEGDSGIAACLLHNGVPGMQNSRLLCSLQHREGCPVFAASRRIVPLEFAQKVGPDPQPLLHPDRLKEGSISNQVSDRGGNSTHLESPPCFNTTISI